MSGPIVCEFCGCPAHQAKCTECACAIPLGYSVAELAAMPFIDQVDAEWDTRGGNTILALVVRELIRRVGRLERAQSRRLPMPLRIEKS